MARGISSLVFSIGYAGFGSCKLEGSMKNLDLAALEEVCGGNLESWQFIANLGVPAYVRNARSTAPQTNPKEAPAAKRDGAMYVFRPSTW